MHRRVDDFVAIAIQHADDADRTATMHGSMFDYLRDELDAHGYSGDDDRLHAIIDVDIKLNTMGLEHWLEHNPRRRNGTTT
jgi:hypothetical protein